MILLLFSDSDCNSVILGFFHNPIVNFVALSADLFNQEKKKILAIQPSCLEAEVINKNKDNQP